MTFVLIQLLFTYKNTGGTYWHVSDVLGGDVGPGGNPHGRPGSDPGVCLHHELPLYTLPSTRLRAKVRVWQCCRAFISASDPLLFLSKVRFCLQIEEKNVKAHSN